MSQHEYLDNRRFRDLSNTLHLSHIAIYYEQKIKPFMFVLEFYNDIVRHLEMIFISYINTFA